MAIRPEVCFSSKGDLPPDRQRAVAMTAEQAECERAERIEAFDRDNPEVGEMLDDAVSRVVIQEHCRVNGLPADEYRNYKVIAVYADDICGNAERYRILLEDVENGVRHLLTATGTLETTESAAYDVDSVCRFDILDELIQRDNNKPGCRYVGCTISLRTIEGAPTLPMPKEKYKAELRKTMKD